MRNSNVSVEVWDDENVLMPFGIHGRMYLLFVGICQVMCLMTASKSANDNLKRVLRLSTYAEAGKFRRLLSASQVQHFVSTVITHHGSTG